MTQTSQLSSIITNECRLENIDALHIKKGCDFAEFEFGVLGTFPRNQPLNGLLNATSCLNLLGEYWRLHRKMFNQNIYQRPLF